MPNDLASAVLSDCRYSLAINADFDSDKYSDSCYCRKNLRYIIAELNASKQSEHCFQIAKKMAEWIIQNNNETRCNIRKCGHYWSDTSIRTYLILNSMKLDVPYGPRVAV